MAIQKSPLANRKKISELQGAHDSVALKKRELSTFQEEWATPLTSADQHLQEVKVFVEQLRKMALQFEEAGSAVKRQFSLQVKQDALQAEIKSALQVRAEAQAATGMPEEQNLKICQAFIDDVLVYLAKEGIRLNPLNVMKMRKAR